MQLWLDPPRLDPCTGTEYSFVKRLTNKSQALSLPHHHLKTTHFDGRRSLGLARGQSLQDNSRSGLKSPTILLDSEARDSDGAISHGSEEESDFDIRT